MNEIKDPACDRCGRKFKYLHHLTQHQKRKTPCIVLNVAPAVREDPNHCIYCNKVYSSKYNLTKHQKICKIKVAGVAHLPDHIRLEERLRINEDERAKEREETQKRLDELAEQIRVLKGEKAQVVNNINNIVVNGDVNNNTVNINIHDWTEPSIEKIKLTVEQLVLCKDMQQLFFMLVYMNPDIPENHSIIPRNIKEKRVTFHLEQVWRTCVGDEMMAMLGRAAYISSTKGIELMTGRNGLVPNCDPKIYKTLPLSLQQHIESGVLKEKLTPEQVFNILFDNQGKLKIPNLKKQ